MSGPRVDIIGDVHGCAGELCDLLAALGYRDEDGTHRHPAGRRAVFVGDLVGRGPSPLAVVDLVGAMVAAGSGASVCGNHDRRLDRSLAGLADPSTGDADAPLASELAMLTPTERAARRAAVAGFLRSLPARIALDGGMLVVAHAGLPEHHHGVPSAAAERFAVFGSAGGSAARDAWAWRYGGPARVVHGHTPVARPRWINRTLNIDTGCVYGGALTALRYPQLALVSVPARGRYARSRRFERDAPVGVGPPAAGGV